MHRQDFVDRIAEGQDLHGATLKIMQLVTVVDADMAIDRGPQIVRRERLFRRVFTLRVGRSDDLTCPHTAARNKDRHRARPMIAAWLFDTCLRTAAD